MKNSTQKELLIKIRTDLLVEQMVMAEILALQKESTYEHEYNLICELANKTEVGVRRAVDDWDIQFWAEAN